ncbi:glycosyltransferase involved in cell wall biosynthesis [Winogradskyella epiphytica]|uniref:Glycosyltransferase involved in cell wall biosynthesis n=1 Tax=Winogradskyella epiphytica TaxID=262005 RepID=A0A2V4XJK2_9FLAO|nr:glycosyltransferase [Winogradskyella epiphytica]PYE81833.1 glycosyltransferase involved in cell wall biosynthesis [Winogradskyella epiphytica]GGW62328.1 hypothetical protein GCM10008085_12600 [Winogradskyella epiphytica]
MNLSVIIPLYNAERDIGRCLDSLIDQGLSENEYEIIVVNDGSLDDSLKIVISYAKKYSQIKVLDKENGGVGSARNSGIDCAKGKYIYFLDSDDFLVPNRLGYLVELSDKHELDILTFMSTPHYTKSLEGKSISKNREFDVTFGDNHLSAIVTGEEYVAKVKYRGEVWWFLINREFLLNSGIRFVEGRFLEDLPFSISLILDAKRIAHIDLDVHRYRIAPGSILTSTEPQHFLKVIRDLQYAATAFGPIIEKLERNEASTECIRRIKARQQSLVFFSMVRTLKSTMPFKEVKLRLKDMKAKNAYPLTSFLGKDYNGLSYQVLVRLFNQKYVYYALFLILNPLLRFKNK